MITTRCRRFDGRVAIVTGSANGIGRSYASRLSAEGAEVVVADLDEEAAQEVAGELSRYGPKALAIRCDVADEESVAAMVRATVDSFRKIDVLVNNAGMMTVVPISRVGFEDISPDEWDRMMRVNLTGTWLACKAVVPEMRKNKYGKIVNVSSGTVFKGAATRIHYVSSKAAVIGFTRTLARELGPDNITVNCIAPGATLTEEKPSEDTLVARQKKSTDRAIQRVQLPEDAVGAMAFLASEDSDFVTGQTLIVDGGSVMN
jgi:3-oxoacyl-[acyl-carrier protein] reductase